MPDKLFYIPDSRLEKFFKLGYSAFWIVMSKKVSKSCNIDKLISKIFRDKGIISKLINRIAVSRRLGITLFYYN